MEFEIQIAKQLLERGEVVAIPTETVYGLAANAYNQRAVSKIFKIKNRPTFDPLIVHTNSLEKIHDFVKEFPEKAYVLAQNLWPGALTLLLPKKEIIPDLVTAGLPRVAVRIPKHPLTLSLLAQLDFPLAAPSANPFGYVSPTTAQHVSQQLGNQIPFILDGGACQLGIESTIVGFENDETWIYRLGGITVETIQSLIGEVKIKPFSSADPTSPQAAGMLTKHYATHTPLMVGEIPELLAEALQQFAPHQIGILFTQHLNKDIPVENQIILPAITNFEEAAQKLFASLRYLDALNLKIIIAPRFPNQHLGKALNDRLMRASSKK
ncbi:MAG: L-threonylcarbamoyladenylate synthase [Microscillaceae bacterium]|nr:L-threonylcarbamoyladenylate synthase [Microscillaceae bacterium]MDW8460707.1 L-threonylcarbamoyladenylate synthase [Cytophagales bacterium]